MILLETSITLTFFYLYLEEAESDLSISLICNSQILHFNQI